ncbi:MAG: efflux RND transporter periplasmic adaptor subunit [Gammaproteobacteria bacterium]
MASRKTRLIRRIVFMSLFVAVVYGGPIGFNRYIGAIIRKAMASAPPPVVSVSTAKAQNRTWHEELHAVSSLKAVQGTTLTTQTAGTVIGLHFHSGEDVKAGTLLVQLNDNVARAQLVADKAKLLNAHQQLQRQRKLYARQATSQSQLQEAEAAFAEAEAAVQADQAALTNLQVRAPFDGHLGIRQVSLGQYVSPGTSVVDIHQWKPLLVDFQVPQRDLARIAVGDAVGLTVAGMKDRTFEGRITSLGSSLDNGTRSLGVEATVPNADNRLRPGMFGEVTVKLAAENKVVAVPQTAISYSTYGEYVYVITHTDKGVIAQQRVVRTGSRRNDMVAVTHGVKPGEEVVTAGQVNLYSGAHVKIQPPSKALREAGAQHAGS